MRKSGVHIFFDLEFTQPNERIIEIGAVVADVYNNEIISEFEMLVNPGESLSDEVAKLTGIKEKDLESSVPIDVAWGEFIKFISQFELTNELLSGGKVKLITIGKNDINVLIRDLKRRFAKNIPHPTASLDLKDVYIALCLAKGINAKRGLSSIMKHMGLKISGDRHRALSDATNTCALGFKLLGQLRRGVFKNG